MPDTPDPVPGHDAYETLELTQNSEHVLQLTMNRPNVLNAMNTRMMTELAQCFRQFYIDQAQWRVIILTGAGERAFCAGGDLKERDGMTDATWRRQHAILEQMIHAVMQCPVPVISAVNGSCFGGGFEVALASDFILAADTARFGFPEGKRGIMPGACGTQNLARACGQRRAKEIMLTGETFTAEQVLEYGVVNHVFPGAELMSAAAAIAQKITTTAPVSARQIKKAIDIAVQTDLGTGYAFEIEAYNRTVPTRDRLEGVAAFNEKRPPVFTGE
ncbi:MAG: enoyl-CoA hydratase/isomerase family protein [Gammaproteobacteria bacterium]|nr:enoyl-CoA hydratase/isomerase family protein [Gammaproteobacteria bacterium]